MAARTNKLVLTDRWREKIRVSMILNRLRNHVLGRIELSATQIQAARILLGKVLPDLAAVEHSGEVEHTFVARLPAVAVSVEEWRKNYTIQEDSEYKPAQLIHNAAEQLPQSNTGIIDSASPGVEGNIVIIQASIHDGAE